MNTERTLNPSDFTEDQLKTLAFAIAGQLKKHFDIERPMGRIAAAEFTGVSQRTFDRMVAAGKFRSHRIEEGAHPYYFPSELLEDLKKY